MEWNVEWTEEWNVEWTEEWNVEWTEEWNNGVPSCQCCLPHTQRQHRRPSATRIQSNIHSLTSCHDPRLARHDPSELLRPAVVMPRIAQRVAVSRIHDRVGVSG